MFSKSLITQTRGVLTHKTEEKESATYRWKNVYQIYLAKDCIYLFMTQNRAFILPYSDMKEGFDTAFSIIKKRAKDKVTDLRK